MKSNNNTKVNDLFKKINDNFLSSSDTTDYKRKASRKGVAFKTILLLLITSFTAVTFFSLFKMTQLKFPYLWMIKVIFLTSSFATSIFYIAAMLRVEMSRLCSCLFAVLEGLTIGIFFHFINCIYSNLLEIVFIALFSTLIIFCVMAHAYYKGTLKVTQRFTTIMQRISIALFFTYLIRLFFVLFGVGTIENILYYSILVIPLSLFMLGFLSMYLAIHFDYTEQMIQQGLPEKYEWQVSLAFAATLISIFLRIVNLLLRIMGKEKE
ncbi:Conserved hypothetical protein [Candidatus Phytoplasma australiense]|uniref:Uncharacterized protein n=1 Tax=Phytoplasma australiense TaxID=59748 RepID=B1V9W9_PHYAS|nr:Conserved hypothetical protein [Candidatus Phytoplasma australiense]